MRSMDLVFVDQAADKAACKAEVRLRCSLRPGARPNMDRMFIAVLA